jgi:adenylate kinase
MPAHSVTFAPFAIARTKLVLMGPPGALQRRVFDSARSLKETEQVAAGDLFRDETVRMTAAGVACEKAAAAGRAVSDDVAIAIVRRWFWSRKNTRGFILTGFPATLAQAVVLDEWLDARDETLTACLWFEQSRDAALAEADDAQVCPRDGTVYYPSRDSLTIPGHCDGCGEALQPAGDRARAEVLAWFDGASRAAEAVAKHYRQRGLLVTIDADRPLDVALAEFSESVRSLVADR